MRKFTYILLPLMLLAFDAAAQVDKRDVRKGNRDYRKENYKEAEIEYRKAIVKDSLSMAANYISKPDSWLLYAAYAVIFPSAPAPAGL